MVGALIIGAALVCAAVLGALGDDRFQPPQYRPQEEDRSHR